MLDEQSHGLLAAAGRFVVGVLQRLYTYIYYRALALLLAVVEPADDRHNAGQKELPLLRKP